MWIVFEGIDGSGKTTLSNRVAGELRSRGVAVAHMREGGQFASRVTQSIRELGRDPANLTLSPRAELLLYLAREVQLVDESVAPALEGTDVVICDRFVHTAEVLAVHGRGLPADEVETLVEWSAHGLEPNLTILIDVDPQVARARRRVAKIVTPDPRPSSRKGLTGVGMQHRLRAGYLELARRDPARWIVVDNTDADLDALTAHLTEIVLATLYAGVPAGQERSRLGELRSPARRARSSGGVTLEDVVPTFLSWIDDCAAREPALAAYFLAGLAGPEVDPHRLALARTAPAVIAWGLRGLGDPVSWTLRHVLSDRAPGPVSRRRRHGSCWGPAARLVACPAALPLAWERPARRPRDRMKPCRRVRRS